MVPESPRRYGLPPTYWEAFDGIGRTPVVMDMFQERGYQLVRCAGNAAIGSRSSYGGERVEVWASAPGHLPRPRALPAP